MSGAEPSAHATRRRVVRGARWIFLVAVLVGAGLAFRGHGEEVLAAIRSTSVGSVLAASVLVLLGLIVTSVAWLELLRGFGHPLPGGVGRSVFFVGQLGKYVPGGLWSIGAHAHLARDHGVPLRVTASTSLTFLGLNLATAGVVVGGVAATGVEVGPLSRLAGLALAVGSLVLLVPLVVNRLAGLVAGVVLPLRWRDLASLVVLMAITWTSYAGAVVVLSPEPSWSGLPRAAAAFALAYAIGVAVVIAPAGVGAREVTLVALLSPMIGVGPAGAVAILTRVLHTGADLLLALVAWAVAPSSATAVGQRLAARASPSVHERVAGDP
ncbi:lysylphosphatidylglycerol synthase transmembrane domain-containing protein [soil metagenome]